MLSLGIVSIGSVFSKENKKTGRDLSSLIPGTLLQQSSADLFILDRGWHLYWPSSGSLQVRNVQGQVLAQVNLSQRPIAEGRAEAHGLEVEESDLGGGGGGRYLQGKKQPKGRKFKSENLSSATPTAQAQVSSKQVQGIKISTQQFPNGAKILEWDWGQTQESVFLDRRETLVWVKQERKTPRGNISLQQFGDGSFTRRLEKGKASFAYTWDTLSNSAQLSFKNAQGEAIAEFRCDARGICE